MEDKMRDNSGKGKSKNNLRDPTLKEHEAAGGRMAERPGREMERDMRAAGAEAGTGRPRSATSRSQ
jgi:hypothetical protein